MVLTPSIQVIEHMDHVLETGTEQEIYDLKALFGLESVSHDDDFMAALEWAPWLWQGNQFYATTGFYTWCDFVEGSVNETDPAKIPGAEGVGLEKALQGYARWGREYYFPGFCKSTYGYYGGGLNTECFDTYNASNVLFTDTTLSNTADRQWVWMTCNVSQTDGFGRRCQLRAAGQGVIHYDRDLIHPLAY